ncbi:MAG: glycosyl hydrolase, partial [Gemmatimonadota bacterium]
HDQATEPGNPDITYAETQQGGLHRIDRITGDQVSIQPQAGEGEDFERFNWDAPIEVSFHDPARIYHASQRVWRSDDRGDSWTAISGDLTRDQERIELPIMGRTQSWDNPWDVSAMSNYNTITSIGESPLDEDLIYAGTDDGLLQVTEDGGESWREIEVGSLPGVPATAFVNDIKADHHDPNTVYVALDDHKNGDFSPYLVKSTDRGQSWTSIAGDLPERHLVWRVVQDHVDPDLLFAGTEFGLFFTADGGDEWIELGGAPTISFRDVVIQRDHEDLVGASFGRGIFVLDDYTPLRDLDADALSAEGALLAPRTALWYEPKNISDSQGHSAYAAENPPFGAVFTYHLGDGFQSQKAERQEREGDIEEGEDVPFPGWDELEAEMREQGPEVQIVIRDEAGTVINRVEGPTSAGVHRVSWDLEHSPKNLVGLGDGGFGGGFLALPGSYEATLVAIEQGEVTELAGPVDFEVEPLYEGALPRASDEEVASFREQVIAFQRELTRTGDALDEQVERVEAMQTALERAERDDPDLESRLYDTRLELLELRERMEGSEAKGEIGERGPPTPSSRLFIGFRGLSTTYGPTELHRHTIRAGQNELAPIREEVERIGEQVIPGLERALEAAGAPPVEGQGGGA